MTKTKFLAAIAFAVLLAVSASEYGMTKSMPAESGETAFVHPKKRQVVTPKAFQYLEEKAADQNGIVKIWAFFTDKGVKSERELRSISAAISERITDRAMKRRAKVGKDQVELIDVPVVESYVTAIEDLGAKLRHTSRYLNAASFEIPFGLIDRVAELPFVREVRPMIGFKKDYSVETTPKDTESQESLDGAAFDYGLSYGQLNQINVLPAHDAGYYGTGVLVAMFDTGFRTDHQVFTIINLTNRLIAERDFVFGDDDVDNEPEDWSSAWSHGTLTWSTLGGQWTENLYGPAFGADFILAKTEDVRSETPVEEDNWVAAVEWADSIGADVISSSLGYSDWYTTSDYDGNTATTTIAADMAAAMGIVVCNSAGNNGCCTTTISAPADADSVLAIGAVSSSGGIASFSSRGPSYDGRIKPEVCAQGVSTRCASSSSQSGLTYANGTSLSCPLAGGVAALVIEANPDWTPMQVREAIMMTAHIADNPNNTYGWGIINAWEAMNYQSDPEYTVGDVNESGGIDVDDVVYLIAYLFQGGPDPIPVADAGDVNDTGEIDIDDVVYLIAYVFQGGPAPIA